MGFFTSKFTKTDAFFVSLSNIAVFILTYFMAVGKYSMMGKKMKESTTLTSQFTTCLEYANSVDAWWGSQLLFAIILTPVIFRFYLSHIKPQQRYPVQVGFHTFPSCTDFQ